MLSCFDITNGTDIVLLIICISSLTAWAFSLYFDWALAKTRDNNNAL